MNRAFHHTCLAMLCVALFAGADWRQFRGNDSNGIAPESQPPLSWNEGENENIAWKVPLPGRGLSGPIVVGDRVVVTGSSGFRQDRLHVLCFDAQSGEPLWERQFWATGRTMTHPKTNVAAPTPASDGERIFAFFSSNDLACLDLDGNLLWFRGLNLDFPNATNSLGMASSPIVAGDTLVVQVESDDDSFATGLDVETGRSRWKIDRPRAANWTSPVLLRGASSDQDRVILQSSKGVAAVYPATGSVEWSYDKGASTIPSGVVCGETLYVPSHGITALRPAASGETPEVLWQVNRLSPSTASPLVYEGRVFTLNSAGVVSCGDATDGKLLWQLRLEGPFSGSPVAAGGRVYYFNEKGRGFVVRPGDDKGEIVGNGELEGTVLCTPAVADGAIYVRSDEHLWKIAE